MSERKEDEEMVDHGSTESSESEHMVDTHVQLEDSPQQEHQSEIPSGNSDSTRSDDGDRNVDSERFVESAEAVQFNAQEVHLSNGDASSPFKSTVDGVKGEGESKTTLKEGNEYMEVNGNLVQPEGEEEQATVVDKKGGDENAEELKKLEEPNNSEVVKIVEESVIVEEPKYVKEPLPKEYVKEPLPKAIVETKDAGDLKVEVNAVVENPGLQENGVKEQHLVKQESAVVPYSISAEGYNQSFPSSLHMVDGDDSGTEEEQAAFTRELESFFRERSLEFKHPKFYGEGLNCLKLWRAVTRLGGYDRVTACKLWRQVGESFHPPKTCTTVSWSFRIFYEKALLDYERHKTRGGELVIPASPLPETLGIENHMGSHQGSGSGRARRDAAARAMQGWHSQRLLGNGEVGDPIIKDKNALSTPKREKQLKSLGMLKRKKPNIMDRSVKALRPVTKLSKPQIHTDIVDDGPAADWVKINVRRTKDCFEVYALVPGLLREEVRVQSDPAGRLVISGDPEQPDNPWGVTPFRKVISLPSRIDPHQTSAVVTLHGQLFVRVPFEQSDL